MKVIQAINTGSFGCTIGIRTKPKKLYGNSTFKQVKEIMGIYRRAKKFLKNDLNSSFSIINDILRKRPFRPSFSPPIGKSFEKTYYKNISPLKGVYFSRDFESLKFSMVVGVKNSVRA